MFSCCLLLPSVSLVLGLRPVRWRWCVRLRCPFRLSLSWPFLPPCSGSVRLCHVPAPPALRRPSVCPGPAPSVLALVFPSVSGSVRRPPLLRCLSWACVLRLLSSAAPPVRTACQQLQQQHSRDLPDRDRRHRHARPIYTTTTEKPKKAVKG